MENYIILGENGIARKFQNHNLSYPLSTSSANIQFVLTNTRGAIKLKNTQIDFVAPRTNETANKTHR